MITDQAPELWRVIVHPWPETHYCPICKRPRLMTAAAQGRVLVTLLLFRCDDCEALRVVDL